MGRVKVNITTRPNADACFYIQTPDQFNRSQSIDRGEYVHASGTGTLNATDNSLFWSFNINTPIAADYYFVFRYGFYGALPTVLEYQVKSLERPLWVGDIEYACETAILILELFPWFARK